MDPVKSAGFIDMKASIKGMVDAHNQIHEDIGNHAQAHADRIAKLREGMDAHNQMKDLTGKVDYT